ncbi:lipopolysaccharide heptosyltransferase I [Helicobacter sp. faydin-H20]|uniref:lipopolysaccharide heptosyltransferase I n=1 Tax=Helicobacter anatolicus TaxID=2905874 RepID=UPI001E56148C|nr:lipopolysaccharide heptosyltransferase I [Helicobacter anatolicus]MCE3037340.1 lipopolysaccharide heptosyltransferase I [Helicobacter anatolicus]
MRIAIIRLSALGDIIISASFVSCIVEIFEGCEIDWYVDSRFAGILQDSPLVKVYAIPLKTYIKTFNFRALFSLRRDLKKKEYDYVIDMQGLLKSALVGSFFQTKNFIGFDKKSIKEPLASFFYQQKIEIDYQESITKRNAKILFEALNPSKDFEIFFQNAMRSRSRIFGYTQGAKTLIKQEIFQDKKNILLLLEASLEAKSYSTKRIIELLKLVKNKEWGFLLLYYQDFDKAKEIFESCKNDVAIKILPKINLDAIKALVDSVDLVIGGDTGITHLAWAMEKASITLYGNTPLKRFELLGVHNISLSGNEQANYNKNDFSINHIEPSLILESMERVL